VMQWCGTWIGPPSPAYLVNSHLCVALRRER